MTVGAAFWADPEGRFRAVADVEAISQHATMKVLTRIGALDIAQAISDQIGSYVHMEFIQFLAADADRIHCWYMNSGGEGPSFGIEIMREKGGWTLHLNEFPAGTEQNIEVP